MRWRTVVFILVVALGIFSFVFTALRRPGAAQAPANLQIFLEEGFEGPSLGVTGSLIDMPVIADENGVEVRWNDNVGSVIVYSGTWRLSQHGRCNTEIDDTPLREARPRDEGEDRRLELPHLRQLLRASAHLPSRSGGLLARCLLD